MELRATILRNENSKISDILTKMEKNFLRMIIFWMATETLKNCTEQKTENLAQMQQIQFALNADWLYHAKQEFIHWNSKRWELLKNLKKTNSYFNSSISRVSFF